ncbi:phosphoribosyl-AMP cyclohydrolase [Litoribrevibacter albus]|uniref:Phosphoribosyl-AMP cyclohydrolase n=1 Tax=Litoribrevibacter albus TaxID=1473156 RepID=A0AA37S9F6_9GAMM|nr:phosphoribosyl-AMP cyclohydrolase [Litoribrevibacter albus]GLQ30678.1 phosphoribosyl-AMP cyclohydrolase [Litoribrevibacter albus]
MSKLDWKAIEKQPSGSHFDLEQALDSLKYNSDGLIPAIAQQHDTGEVLMMAWMNKLSIEETLKTKQVCYWSRSRQTYWRKGESSGHQQTLISMATDCDADTLLLKVDQKGPACHTNRRSCFYNEITEEQVTISADPIA